MGFARCNGLDGRVYFNDLSTMDFADGQAKPHEDKPRLDQDKIESKEAGLVLHQAEATTVRMEGTDGLRYPTHARSVSPVQPPNPKGMLTRIQILAWPRSSTRGMPAGGIALSLFLMLYFYDHLPSVSGHRSWRTTLVVYPMRFCPSSSIGAARHVTALSMSLISFFRIDPC